MFLQIVLILLITYSNYINCKSIKNGVFENVTVYVRGLDKTTTEDIIFIAFDDNLATHINNKPSDVVIIKNQFIPKLETDSVANLPRVQNLSLANNGIREIQVGTFKNLPNLKALNLSHNAIEEIKSGIFNNLTVKDLYLNNNKISKIRYKAFSNLRLKNLFLNNNKISRWSKDWVADSSVTVLNMGYNLIEELPINSFYLMKKPADNNINVIFTNNQLRNINNNAFNGFDSFNRIFLDSNSIDHLSSEVFHGVKHINQLNLNNNSISTINADLFRTTKVDILMLEDNKLKCISTDVFQMEELDIDGNPITCLCVKLWLDWRDYHSNPSIYHITNLEQDCL